MGLQNDEKFLNLLRKQQNKGPNNELYQMLGKKFEEDPTTKELPVCIVDNECGEMEAERVEFRPKSIVDGKPMNMVRLDW